MGHVKDITGQKYGKLTVIRQDGFTKINKHGSRYAVWLCKRDCGNYCHMDTGTIKNPGNHSCGCLAIEHLKDMCAKNVTHGMTGSRLLGCYKGMMSRCYREKGIHYNAYGKRGITVCDEWKNSKQSFINWALSHGYADDLTIERIDVNGNYEPSNCKWIPMSEQYKNKQSNCMKMPLPEPYKEDADD